MHVSAIALAATFNRAPATHFATLEAANERLKQRLH